MNMQSVNPSARFVRVKHVIFDLAEVLMPGMMGVERGLAIATGLPKDIITRSLGIYPHYQVGNILDDLLKGKISYEQYRSAFLLATGLPEARSALFDEECLKMLATPYDYTEDLLAQVATKCDLFLVSDHCEPWVTWIKRRHAFLSMFKDMVWSYEIGATKHELKPFEVILSRNGLQAGACLFVDDLEKNCVAARRLGMQAVRFVSPRCIPEIYAAIGLGGDSVPFQNQRIRRGEGH